VWDMIKRLFYAFCTLGAGLMVPQVRACKVILAAS
jgi:hypothetical protein